MILPFRRVTHVVIQAASRRMMMMMVVCRVSECWFATVGSLSCSLWCVIILHCSKSQSRGLTRTCDLQYVHFRHGNEQGCTEDEHWRCAVLCPANAHSHIQRERERESVFVSSSLSLSVCLLSGWAHSPVLSGLTWAESRDACCSSTQTASQQVSPFR